MRRICSHSYSLDIFSLSLPTSLSLSTSQIILPSYSFNLFQNSVSLFRNPTTFQKAIFHPFPPFPSFHFIYFPFYLLTRLFLPISFFSFRHLFYFFIPHFILSFFSTFSSSSYFLLLYLILPYTIRILFLTFSSIFIISINFYTHFISFFSQIQSLIA